MSPSDQGASNRAEQTEDVAYWRTIFEVSPAPIFVYAADGRVQQVNAAGRALFDVTENERQTLAGSYNLLEDDDLRAGGQLDTIRRAFDGEPVFIPSMSYDVTPRSAEQPPRYWVQGYAYPLKDEAGAVMAVVVSLLDVSELHRIQEALRESEQRFREMAANVRDVFWLFDWHERRVIYVSPAYETVWGQSAAELYRDYARWGESIHPDDRESAFQSLEGAAKTGGGESRCYRIIRPDGSLRWISDRAFAVRDESGEVVRMTGIAEDITQERRADEERRKLEARIQQAQKLESLSVLAGGVAHDFNNILLGVLGNAELAARDLPKGSSTRGFVDQIAVAATRAAEFTRQMLAYSGKGAFVIEQVDLNQLVTEMAHLLETTVSKKAELRLELASNVPAIVCDPTQMRQIVMNLITNASESLGTATGRITIRTALTRAADWNVTDAFYVTDLVPNAAYALLSVTDTGCGMDSETRDKMFDPFFTTKFTGRGLGMAAVLGIVRGHQGAIAVRSQEGEGSTIELLLPGTDAAAATGPGAAEPARALRLDGQLILLADDVDLVRSVTSTMLADAGAEVVTAADGREALAIFEEHSGRIGLVLLDALMPGLGGDEVFAELKRQRPDVPVVVTSGYSEEDVLGRFGRERPAGFLQKPFGQTELLDAVSQALGRRQSGTSD